MEEVGGGEGSLRVPSLGSVPPAPGAIAASTPGWGTSFTHAALVLVVACARSCGMYDPDFDGTGSLQHAPQYNLPHKISQGFAAGDLGGSFGPSYCKARFLPACLQSWGSGAGGGGLPFCPCPPRVTQNGSVTGYSLGPITYVDRLTTERARGAWVPAEAAARGLGAGKSAAPTASPRFPAPAKVESLRLGDSGGSLSGRRGRAADVNPEVGEVVPGIATGFL